MKQTITKDIAMKLSHIHTIYLYNEFNADKTPMRCRVNGTCQTWKTRPFDFKLPVKRGLYEYGYITQNNCDSFYIEE